MKTRILSAVIILAFASSLVFAGNKTETFKVAGNCGMCESRIEKAAESVDGVSAADWDKATKMIEVTFDASLTSDEQIHRAIAEVGHDTEKYVAKTSVYDNLPGCCKYERLPGGKTLD